MEMRDIRGFEGRYAITDTGKVWSYLTNRWLRPGINKPGYRYVRVANIRGGAVSNLAIAPTVLDTFVCPRPPDHVVDHIDHDKQNDHLNNLRWVTQSENLKWAFDQGRVCRKGENCGSSKLDSQQVLAIRHAAAAGVSLQTLAATFSMSPNNLSQIVNRKTWTHLPDTGEHSEFLKKRGRLSPEALREIHSQLKQKEKAHQQIADDFDVSRSHISNIASGHRHSN